MTSWGFGVDACIIPWSISDSAPVRCTFLSRSEDALSLSIFWGNIFLTLLKHRSSFETDVPSSLTFFSEQANQLSQSFILSSTYGMRTTESRRTHTDDRTAGSLSGRLRIYLQYVTPCETTTCLCCITDMYESAETHQRTDVSAV